MSKSHSHSSPDNYHATIQVVHSKPIGAVAFNLQGAPPYDLSSDGLSNPMEPEEIMCAICHAKFEYEKIIGILGRGHELLCNDFDGTLIQLTQIVNNNDLVVDQVDTSDSDTHLNHDLADDDYSPYEKDIVNVESKYHSNQNINYHSNAIPYLDSTKESPKNVACMRDSSSI
ncbi:hypothetical protein HAX54_022617 [Datura stramonium]|uniref:Uncharacterized protein n=1 Tax=Datura stramonium TaxID=4076 RepID=A0ABS8S6K2_DATST|nr:hypothetical protein [Datura stramonium]